MKCEFCNGYGELTDAYFCHNCGFLEHILYILSYGRSNIKCKSCGSNSIAMRIHSCYYCKGTGVRNWIDEILRPISI